MRFLFKVSIPVESGNAAAKDGFKAIQTILDQQKPEAAYFIAEGGRRTGILILNMDDVTPLFTEFADQHVVGRVDAQRHLRTVVGKRVKRRQIRRGDHERIAEHESGTCDAGKHQTYQRQNEL